VILDYQADPDHAQRHEILDAETFRPLDAGLPVFYADDARGVLRMYVRDDAGTGFLLAYAESPHHPLPPSDYYRRFDRLGRECGPELVVAWVEVRRSILIVPKREGT
jgi:hypothetical protein